MATDTVPIAERGVATLSEQAWERARCRAEIIGPLAQSETVGHEAADAAAQALGLSRRQVYVLIRRGAASRVSGLFFLVPPCTALIAWPLFDETLGLVALLGMVLTVAGVAMASR